MQFSNNRTPEHPPFSFPYPIASLLKVLLYAPSLALTIAVVLTLDFIDTSLYHFLDTVLFDAALERLAFQRLFLTRRS